MEFCITAVQETPETPLARLFISDDFCAWRCVTRTHRRCGIADRHRPRDARFYHHAINTRGRIRLDATVCSGTVAASRSRQGALREASHGQSGMRRPALLPCKQHPGGSGNPPSATTSGREELTDGEAFLLHPAPDRSHKSRGGAPRGERRRCDARRPLTPAGHRHWPADGCRCTRAPVGAPLPSFVMRGNWQTSEDICLAGTTMHVQFRSPHGAKRNAGRTCIMEWLAPDFAALHPGYKRERPPLPEPIGRR